MGQNKEDIISLSMVVSYWKIEEEFHKREEGPVRLSSAGSGGGHGFLTFPPFQSKSH